MTGPGEADEADQVRVALGQFHGGADGHVVVVLGVHDQGRHAQLLGAGHPVEGLQVHGGGQAGDEAPGPVGQQPAPDESDGLRDALEPGLVLEHVDPVDHGAGEHDGAHPVGELGAVHALQGHGPAHGPAEQHDVLGALVQGVPDGRLDVVPLRGAEPVAAVLGVRGVPVVAVGHQQGGHAELLGAAHRADALVAAGPAAVDHDRPHPVPGPWRAVLGGRRVHTPGGGRAVLHRDLHVHGVEPGVLRGRVDEAGEAAAGGRVQVSRVHVLHLALHGAVAGVEGDDPADARAGGAAVEGERIGARDRGLRVRRQDDPGAVVAVDHGEDLHVLGVVAHGGDHDPGEDGGERRGGAEHHERGGQPEGGHQRGPAGRVHGLVHGGAGGRLGQVQRGAGRVEAAAHRPTHPVQHVLAQRGGGRGGARQVSEHARHCPACSWAASAR